MILILFLKEFSKCDTFSCRPNYANWLFSVKDREFGDKGNLFNSAINKHAGQEMSSVRTWYLRVRKSWKRSLITSVTDLCQAHVSSHYHYDHALFSQAIVSGKPFSRVRTWGRSAVFSAPRVGLLTEPPVYLTCTWTDRWIYELYFRAITSVRREGNPRV